MTQADECRCGAADVVCVMNDIRPDSEAIAPVMPVAEPRVRRAAALGSVGVFVYSVGGAGHDRQPRSRDRTACSVVSAVIK